VAREPLGHPPWCVMTVWSKADVAWIDDGQEVTVLPLADRIRPAVVLADGSAQIWRAIPGHDDDPREAKAIAELVASAYVGLTGADIVDDVASFLRRLESENLAREADG
jgi:hypothetical protein